MRKLRGIFNFILTCGVVAWLIDLISKVTPFEQSSLGVTFLHVCFWALILRVFIRKLFAKKPKYNAWRIQ